MKLKRPKKTEFICTACGVHEFIPTDIVLQMDIMDSGDEHYPPTFYCEKCNGLMKPKFFIGHTGIHHIFNDN